MNRVLPFNEEEAVVCVCCLLSSLVKSHGLFFSQIKFAGCVMFDRYGQVGTWLERGLVRT